MSNIISIPTGERGKKTFYPTPMRVADMLLAPIDLTKCRYILEPSAGKGDLAIFTVGLRYEQQHQRIKTDKISWYPDSAPDWHLAWSGVSMDCIEIDPALRGELERNGLRVVHDDFLTYESQLRYDLVVMNPPFDQGADHLLKAIDLMERGGQIACILNAETIKNPYSIRRTELLKALEKYGAEIRFVEGAFNEAERKTDVEIALVTLTIPQAKIDGHIVDDLRKAPTYKTMKPPQGATGLVQYNAIEEWVNRYNFEVACGIRLMDEYLNLTFDGERPLVRVAISCSGDGALDLNNLDESKNRFIKETRRKYWNRLFMQPVIAEKFTSNILQELRDNVNKLVDYEFSAYNILSLIVKFNAKAVQGIEETIVNLFDKWTASYWHEESPNRHYFNGWCTNDCFRIGKKVIVSFRAFGYYGYSETFEDYRVLEYLEDIEKTLDFLDNGNTQSNHDLRGILKKAKADTQYKNIETKYFFVTFYKKGTAHLVFKDMALLEKFNMFAAQRKGWLPPDYGKKHYRDMEPEAQKVVDSFQGAQKYEEVMARADYYLNTGNSPLMLGV